MLIFLFPLPSILTEFMCIYGLQLQNGAETKNPILMTLVHSNESKPPVLCGKIPKKNIGKKKILTHTLCRFGVSLWCALPLPTHTQRCSLLLCYVSLVLKPKPVGRTSRIFAGSFACELELFMTACRTLFRPEQKLNRKKPSLPCLAHDPSNEGKKNNKKSYVFLLDLLLV